MKFAFVNEIATVRTNNSKLRARSKKYVSFFSTKTNVVVTHKNRLNETILLRLKTLKLMGKKIFTILRSKISLLYLSCASLMI